MRRPHHRRARGRPVRPPAQRPLRRRRGPEVDRGIPVPATSLDLKFFSSVSTPAPTAAQDASRRTQRGRTSASARAKVEEVASNRRIVGADGKVQASPAPAPRKIQEVRAEPEGLIDPWLQDASFWDGDDASGGPALLRDAPDELLRRRPGQQPTSAAWPARRRRTRNGRLPGLLHRLRRQRDRRQVQRRRQGEPRLSCATACTTPWWRPGRHDDARRSRASPGASSR